MFNLALNPLFCQTCVMLSLRFLAVNFNRSKFFFVGGQKC